MDKTTTIIGAVVLVIIIVAAAVLLTGSGSKNTTTYTSSSTATSAYTTAPTTASSGNTSQLTTAASTTVAATPSYTVLLESSPTYGSYLANASGFTLYTYTNDVPNSGNSSCYSSCASNWPVFYAGNISTAPGLNASDFGTITRTDGTKQTTYRGYPLYFFVGDSKAGDTNGNNVGGFEIATK